MITFLDYKDFSRNVQDLGVDIGSVDGVVKMGTLTLDAEPLLNAQNKNG